MFGTRACTRAAERIIVERDAGIIGISENESALVRWMVAGPEIRRMLNEYDLKYTHNDKETDRHHEQEPSTRRIFAANVESVVQVIEYYDNHFTDDTADLVTIDIKIVLSDKLFESIRAEEEVGTAQYKTFVKDRRTDSSKLFYQPIHKKIFLCSNAD